MINKFKDIMDQRLFAGENSGRSDSDIQLAAAILMFEVIMSDGHVDRMEMAELVDILRRQFDLDGEEIGHILESVRNVGGEQLDLSSFALKLRNQWSQDERLRLLNNLWVIALADQIIDDRERKLIEEIALILDLSETDIQRAQQIAEQKLELGIL